MKKKSYFPYIAAAIILILIIETGLLVSIYRWLGLWPILGWVTLTASLGSYILYQLYFQMEQTRAELKAAFDDEVAQPTEIVFRKLIFPFIGAWLLIFPGLFTDLLALICFLPYLPRLMRRWVVLKPRREPPPESPPAYQASSRTSRKRRQRRKR